ncbi:MAG TPA: HD domain-containing phosphohydrolase [Bdellovibrionota bacterium]|nr:HD domain-containing phosphohydrolase [Bdellovibrionota bacterium]
MITSVTAGKKPKVMVVEDEGAIRELVVTFLNRQGFDARAFENGLLAQQAFGLEKFDAVVSDINMPGSRINGLDLLQYIKQHFPMPVVFMTGYASNSNMKEADSLGIDAFLPKPFKQDDLVTALKSCLKIADQPAEPQEENLDSRHCKLAIEGFFSGKTLQHAIFIRLSSRKYVKIAHGGEDLPQKSLEAFRDKGIKHLYLTKEDFFDYVRSSLAISKAAVNSKAIDNERKLAVMRHTSAAILENLSQHPIDRERYEEAKNIVETTVEFLAQDFDTLNILESLSRSSDYLYAHSVGVSFYSALIARELKWDSPPTLMKVALAGLLHDIGYKEIDPAILEKPQALLAPDEVKLMETHPARGAKLLSEIGKVPDEVLQVVMQHHERDCGLGFPCSLTKNRIHPLAKVVAVADEFCELAIRRREHPQMKITDALARLKTLHGTFLDHNSMAALISIVKSGTLRRSDLDPPARSLPPGRT